MKLVNSTNEAPITSSSNTAKKFSIAVTSKTFDILSNLLYSDKITAVIRELCTNAWDSHVEAGKPEVPFTVHLPNELHPFLSVKDYGVGLSEETVFSLYTTMGESNKTHSNDFTGALGLGSKSPFAYAKSFTVKSCYNGTKSVYSAFLDEEGEPSILKIDSVNTDESNGVEIVVPVHEGDFRLFSSKAEKTLKHYMVRPKVLGNYEHKPEPYILSGDGWRFVNRNISTVIVQGNVEYPLDFSQLNLRERFGHSNYAFGHGFIVYMPLGTVGFTPSRESISYDDYTIKNIEDKLLEIYNELTEIIEEEVNSLHTYYSAVAYKNSFPSLIDWVFSNGKFRYDGKPISDKIKFAMPRYSEFDIRVTKKEGYRLAYLKDSTHKIGKSEHYSLYLSDTYRIILNDVGSKVRSRISENCKYGEKVVLLRHSKNKKISRRELLKTFAPVLGKFGWPEFIFASDLPEKETKKRSAVAQNTFAYNGYKYMDVITEEDEYTEDIDIKEIENVDSTKTVYLFNSRGSYVLDNGAKVDVNIKMMSHFLADSHFDKIIILKRGQKKLITKYSIPSFFTEYVNFIDKMLDDRKDNIKKMFLYKKLSASNSTVIKYVLTNDIEYTGSEFDLQNISNTYKDLNIFYSWYNEIFLLTKNEKLQKLYLEAGSESDEIDTKLKEKFPLVDSPYQYIPKSQLDHVVKYLNAIEGEEKWLLHS